MAGRVKSIMTGGALLALMLQGCAAPPPPPPPAPPPPPPPHAGPPAARLCTVSPFAVKPGGTADIAMIVSHEGGYCAATLTTDAGQPYDVGLVPVAPLHGIPRVVKYIGRTSVEYVPQPGFIGHDSFIVKLIERGRPGYTVLNMSVTVQ